VSYRPSRSMTLSTAELRYGVVEWREHLRTHPSKFELSEGGSTTQKRPQWAERPTVNVVTAPRVCGSPSVLRASDVDRAVVTSKL
jgi:hypothetical protein